MLNMGPGTGKSRIASTIAALGLQLGFVNKVYFLYLDEELKNKEEKLFREFFVFKGWGNKVKWITHADAYILKNDKDKRKTLLIYDESDKIIFEETNQFYEQNQGFPVIALTATLGYSASEVAAI